MRAVDAAVSRVGFSRNTGFLLSCQKSAATSRSEASSAVALFDARGRRFCTSCVNGIPISNGLEHPTHWRWWELRPEGTGAVRVCRFQAEAKADEPCSQRSASCCGRRGLMAPQQELPCLATV